MTDNNTKKLLEFIKPDYDFDTSLLPPSPDYNDLSNWAATPLTEGQQVQGEGPMGPVLCTVMSISDEAVTLDMNHPLAGQNLNFKIEMLSAG